MDQVSGRVSMPCLACAQYPAPMIISSTEWRYGCKDRKHMEVLKLEHACLIDRQSQLWI